MQRPVGGAVIPAMDVSTQAPLTQLYCMSMGVASAVAAATVVYTMGRRCKNL
ncbi:MAG: hypothetical protein QXF26_05480 [Candidatus Bathyarchaeia archaeon]